MQTELFEASSAPGPPPTPPTPRGWGRTIVVFLTVGALAGAGYIGYGVGHQNGAPLPDQTRIAVPRARPTPGADTTPSNGAGTNSDTVDADTIAAKLDPSIVNITTTLSSGGAAAGTGIIISASGLALTNNHVIANTTSLQVENAADGSVHRATVLGYDAADDVALIKIQNVSGLEAAPIGDASRVSIGDAVIALGNAGGQGGTPSVAVGTVTNLDQQITATDEDGGSAERLTHLIEVDANIQPGDSGGPLANASGEVIGMDAAASRSNGGFGFSGGTTNQAFAIPIQHALAIAKQIENGDASADVHIGATRGILGVEVRDDATSDSGASGSGALVSGVASGSGAEAAGITDGAVIVQVGGTSVTSAADLTHALASASPKDTVNVTWIDASGATHHSKIVLGAGPPA